MDPLLLKKIKYIGSWKHFVFVFVCVSLSLYLSFCKYSSRTLSSPDDKLSGNIWFVWFKTSYDVDKWRCHHDGRTKGQTNEQTREYSATQLIDTGSWVSQFYWNIGKEIRINAVFRLYTKSNNTNFPKSILIGRLLFH